MICLYDSDNIVGDFLARLPISLSLRKFHNGITGIGDQEIILVLKILSALKFVWSESYKEIKMYIFVHRIEVGRRSAKPHQAPQARFVGTCSVSKSYRFLFANIQDEIE